MLTDLDDLLRERNLDAILIPMHEAMHPAFRWLARGANVTRGYAVKRCGGDVLLVTHPMERDEAAATGLEVRLVSEFGFDAMQASAASAGELYAGLYTNILREMGATGTIAIVGNLPFPLYLDVAERLERNGWKVSRNSDDLVQLARKRKEPWEIEAIRSVAERTEQVVDSVRGVLRESKIESGVLRHNGRELTLGDLKQLVSREIARLGMVEDHDTILSQGHDAGVPHSRGDAAAAVRASVPIVLDIFPSDRSTGYFFDLTRTFCPGPIPEALARIHAQVLEAFELAAGAVKVGSPAAEYQNLVCEYFESHGHPTIRSNPSTLEGYVHSLGHGVGLEIHEKPFFSMSASNRDRIEIGDVLTIEPGLYYPEREIGVRIEDTFWVDDDGNLQTFCRSERGLTP